MVAQITAVVIFLVMFILIITERFPKHFTTLVCGAVTLILVFGVGMNVDNHFFGKDYSWEKSILETLNVSNIFTLGFWYTKGAHSSSGGIDWATIIFLTGMMIMVEGMARVGFFRWLCLWLAKLVKYKVIPIFIVFMVMSAFLSMFIDSITVILFLSAVTVELATLLKFNPVPMILAEIFCANLGGSATMCGDPPNIIIGSKLGYSFVDFLTNTGLIAGIGLVLMVVYFYFTCRKQLVTKEVVDTSKFSDPKDAITDIKGFVISSLIFALAVVLLITHGQTHLSVATIGLGIAVITILANIKYLGIIFKKVDFPTVLFFTGLFVVVGGLEQTKILVLIADFIKNVSGGNPYVMIAIIIWVSAFASAFIDNIPFAATMVPVITALSVNVPAGVPDNGDPQAYWLATLAWALSMGTDIGGSATPIGASANVVGMAVAQKAGHPVGWGKYCKISAPATLIILAVSTAIIFVRYL